MTFGVRSINQFGYMQIDEERPRLCVLYSGSYQGSSYSVQVNFPSPITTVDPPCIFIRPSTTSATELYRSMSLIGSPGAWTGFIIGTQNVQFYPSGKWFAAVFSARSSADYGLRIHGPTGVLIYDSGTTPVIVTGVVQSWVYTGYEIAGGYRNYLWRASYSVAEDEYVMMNPFSLTAISSYSAATTNMAIRINYSGGYLEIYHQTPAPGPQMDKGNIPAVFGRIHY